MPKIISQIQTSNQQTNFENIKHTENSQEFWYARELMPLLGYAKWETFSNVIQKAKIACKESGNSVDLCFPDAGNTSKMPNGGEKPVENYKLTRYACYLIAMNGDSRKSQIAKAQTYFASQTRKQELLEGFLESQKRVENRDKLTTKRNELRVEVYQRGIDNGSKFANLEDNINLGLYKKKTKEIKKYKGIPDKKSLDNYTSSVELLAKSLSMEMTNLNVQSKDLNGAIPINLEGKQNASSVRETLTERGIIPEDLPRLSDIDKVKKELKKLGNSLDLE